MIVSVITPTCDRPVAFALAEKFMARQTLIADEWIVADGGQHPAPCTMGQIHLREPRAPGPENFARNLLGALATARGDLVVFVEDDDRYAQNHLENMVAAAQAAPHALAIGDDRQRYHNVARRCYMAFSNVGASLCQTAIRREAIPALQTVILDCMARNTYGIDTTFWRSIPRERWALTGKTTVLGIKGLPGCAGLGIGHRPNGSAWTPDPDLATLRQWIGADADLYAGYGVARAA